LENARVALQRHLASTHAAPAGERHPSRILITEVIAAYRREREHMLARADLVAYSVPHLVAFWGDDYLSAITGARCREYVKWRGKTGAARRDLETLRAAVNHFHREYGLDAVPVVTLPPKSEPRQRWLTREEAARFLWAARGVPHLSRFILIGLYTGTRSRALLGLSWLPSTHTGWVDLNAEIIYRRGDEQRKTNKQQTPHPIPSRLLPHLRRWHRADSKFGIKHVTHYQGEPVIKLRRSWATARSAAGLGDDVTPHTLRHTAATWLMQLGVDTAQVAKYLGMTVETLERVYWHHHPDYLKGVKNVFDRAQMGPGARERKRN
jgi:integrase